MCKEWRPDLRRYASFFGQQMYYYLYLSLNLSEMVERSKAQGFSIPAGCNQLAKRAIGMKQRDQI